MACFDVVILVSGFCVVVVVNFSLITGEMERIFISFRSL